ncbi:hypothetical protein [Frankia tisae]|uniref:hypothetical protein n=1 Tax=Frankia tisae TaxID=2950104 RepID=UPI00355782B0
MTIVTGRRRAALVNVVLATTAGPAAAARGTAPGDAMPRGVLSVPARWAAAEDVAPSAVAWGPAVEEGPWQPAASPATTAPAAATGAEITSVRLLGRMVPIMPFGPREPAWDGGVSAATGRAERKIQ